MLAPSILKPVPLHTVLENHAFKFKVNQFFSPDDGSLKYQLLYPKVDWLHVDRENSDVFGTAPAVPFDTRYRIKLLISNEYGYVIHQFYLKVICTEAIENISRKLEAILSLRHSKFSESHIHPLTPDLLEYIYMFLQLPEYKDDFMASLHQQAAEANVKLPQKVTYKDFHHFVHQVNPNIDTKLQDFVYPDDPLLQKRLSEDEFMTLFREGGKQLGTITIPVWNYYGAVEIHNWSSIGTILNYISEKLKQANESHQATTRFQHQYRRT